MSDYHKAMRKNFKKPPELDVISELDQQIAENVLNKRPSDLDWKELSFGLTYAFEEDAPYFLPAAVDYINGRKDCYDQLVRVVSETIVRSRAVLEQAGMLKVTYDEIQSSFFRFVAHIEVYACQDTGATKAPLYALGSVVKRSGIRDDWLNSIYRAGETGDATAKETAHSIFSNWMHSDLDCASQSAHLLDFVVHVYLDALPRREVYDSIDSIEIVGNIARLRMHWMNARDTIVELATLKYVEFIEEQIVGIP